MTSSFFFFNQKRGVLKDCYLKIFYRKEREKEKKKEGEIDQNLLAIHKPKIGRPILS